MPQFCVLGPAGWLASSLNAAARVCMTDAVSYGYDERDDSPAHEERPASSPNSPGTTRAVHSIQDAIHSRGGNSRPTSWKPGTLPRSPTTRTTLTSQPRKPPRCARAAAPGRSATRSRDRQPATRPGLPLRPRIRPQPWLVVSNNARNRLLDDIIAIGSPPLPVTCRPGSSFSTADPLTGYANADCIERLGKDELGESWRLVTGLHAWREPGSGDGTGPYLRTRPTAPTRTWPGGGNPDQRYLRALAGKRRAPRARENASARALPTVPVASVTLLTGITSGPILNPSSAGWRLTARCLRSWPG